MVDIARNRMHERILPADVVMMSAMLSGGLLVDFLRLLSQSYLKAMSQGLESVSIPILNESITEMMEEYKMINSPDDISRLSQVYRTKTIPYDDTFRSLIAKNWILEYRSSRKIWYNIHPLVERLLKQEGHL